MDMKPFTKLVSTGLAAIALGCGARIDVDVDVNGATGDALVDAFFGIGALENQPFLLSEDLDGDGNLDVDEDIDDDFNLDVDEDLNGNGILDDGEDVDRDGNLDVNEDIDGDGNLDIFDEDIDGDGQLSQIPFDLNQDGVIDENDNVTLAQLVLVASGGTVVCEDFANALENGDDFPVSDTVLVLIGIQVALQPNTPVVFSAGNVIENREQGETDLVFLQTAFGELNNGQVVGGRFALDAQTSVLDISKLDATFSASLTATLRDEEDVEFPLSAEFKNVEVCQPLSDVLQQSVESGGIEL